MARTLDFNVLDVVKPDALGHYVAEKWYTWDQFRQGKVNEWTEIQRYIFATDTTKTSNAKLPWSNKTTLPKLAQIRDNLYSNYMASLFPKRKWLVWEADNAEDQELAKKEAIEGYMNWAIDRNQFYNEVSKLVLDYIDYGNVFVMPEWSDASMQDPKTGELKSGYVGPRIRRISPLDIVFNPTAPSFEESPKIIRSLLSLGEVKELLFRSSNTEEDNAFAQELYDYMREIRLQSKMAAGDEINKDVIYQISGFGSYRDYLNSNTVEVLTFYGDVYDSEKDEFLRNQVIKVVDRHKILYHDTNKSGFGTAPIYHCGWRIRPDNLWAMGPLDNLIGMQYRIDHLENLKADCFDLIAFPPLKIKGVVEDFTWGPMERIYVGDDGDVTMLVPDTNVLQADNQIAILEAKMEEAAGSPREAMGFRTPGEKTKYEVQRLENASSRVFQSKTTQFEREVVEPGLNGMLEQARRNMTTAVIRGFNDDIKIATFKELSVEDITGQGRIKPIAARHFAEQAEVVQNLTQFFNSPLGQDEQVKVHISGEKIARLFEEMLDVKSFNLVQPFIRLSEQADAQRIMNSNTEQVQMETGTSSGLFPGDHDMELQGQGMIPELGM